MMTTRDVVAHEFVMIIERGSMVGEKKKSSSARFFAIPVVTNLFLCSLQ